MNREHGGRGIVAPLAGAAKTREEPMYLSARANGGPSARGPGVPHASPPFHSLMDQDRP